MYIYLTIRRGARIAPVAMADPHKLRQRTPLTPHRRLVPKIPVANTVPSPRVPPARRASAVAAKLQLSATDKDWSEIKVDLGNNEQDPNLRRFKGNVWYLLFSGALSICILHYAVFDPIPTLFKSLRGQLHLFGDEHHRMHLLRSSPIVSVHKPTSCTNSASCVWSIILQPQLRATFRPFSLAMQDPFKDAAYVL